MSGATTKLEVRTEIMNSIFADRDRSIESAVERALEAGIQFERERFRAILALSLPPGLERGILVMALCGCSADEVAGFIAIQGSIGGAEAEARRQAFRLVKTE
jgi:hypothetical protein